MMNSKIEAVIRERRTIREVHGEEISEELLTSILEAAAYAPFHSAKEPWKAYMIRGQEEHKEYIERVLNCYSRIKVWEKFGAERILDFEEKTRSYYEMIPVSMVITSKQIHEEKADFEAVLATAALIQNIQLLAWEQQIGVTWRTTADIFDKVFQQEIGIPSNEKIVGTLHFTQIPKKIPKAKNRQPVSDWLHSLELPIL